MGLKDWSHYAFLKNEVILKVSPHCNGNIRQRCLFNFFFPSTLRSLDFTCQQQEAVFPFIFLFDRFFLLFCFAITNNAAIKSLVYKIFLWNTLLCQKAIQIIIGTCQKDTGTSQKKLPLAKYKLTWAPNKLWSQQIIFWWINSVL